jgi:hypothetical protein
MSDGVVLMLDVATALRDRAAPAIVAAARRARPVVAEEVTPEERQQRLTLAFLRHEEQTGALRSLLERSSEPWSQPYVEQALHAAMSAPVFLGLAAEIGGAFLPAILPRCVELLSAEIAQRERQSFERWLFTERKALEQQLARERHEHERGLKAYERETLLQVAQTGRQLDHWPLTLLPLSVTTDADRAPAPAVRLLLAPPPLPANVAATLDAAVLDEAAGDAVRRFVEAYNGAGPAALRFLAGAWRRDAPHTDAAVHLLSVLMQDEPVIVLGWEARGDDLSLRMSYWAAGWDEPARATLIERLPALALLHESAGARARAWREVRDRLVALGRGPEDIARLGGTRAANLRLLDDRDELARAGVDVAQLSWDFQVDGDDAAELARLLAGCAGLAAGWLADAHAVVLGTAEPRLPAALPALGPAAGIPAVRIALIEAYERLNDLAPAGDDGPGRLARLRWSATVARLGDPERAMAIVHGVIAAWLAERRPDRAPPDDTVAAMRPLMHLNDRPYLAACAHALEAAGATEEAERARALLGALVPAASPAGSGVVEIGPLCLLGADGRRTTPVIFLPESDRLLVADGATLALYDLGAHRQLWAAPRELSAMATVNAAGAGHVLLGTYGGRIELWDTRTGAPRWAVDGGPWPRPAADGAIVVDAAAIDPRGRWVAIGGYRFRKTGSGPSYAYDRWLEVRHAGSGAVVQQRAAENVRWNHRPLIDAGIGLLVADRWWAESPTTTGAAMAVLGLPDLDERHVLRSTSPLTTPVALTPDGRHLITTEPARPMMTTYLWEVAAQRARRSTRALFLGLSSDGATLFTATVVETPRPRDTHLYDVATLEVWDVATWTKRREFPLPPTNVDLWRGITSDGRLLCLTEHGGAVRCLDLATGAPAARLTLPHAAGLDGDPVLSPDGRWLARTVRPAGSPGERLTAAWRLPASSAYRL